LHTPANHNTIFLNPIVKNEIICIIEDFKNKKSTGHDKISMNFLQQIKNEISQPLAIVFKKSLSEGRFPKNMKLSKVIPIYKSKEQTNVANYQPISLVPYISSS